MSDVIYFYSRKQKFHELSNFHYAPIRIDEAIYPTVEHFFQAMKFNQNPEYRDRVREADSPMDAKRLGSTRRYPIHPRWDKIRLLIMKRALKAKFTQHEHLRRLLLSTGDKKLVEDSPTDYFWGCGKDRRGENHLGRLLMELRKELNA